MYWALYIKIVDKTVKHKHNFRSHDAVCMFIIWVTTPNLTNTLLDFNVAVILTSILYSQSCLFYHGLSIDRETLIVNPLYIVINLF